MTVMALVGMVTNFTQKELLLGDTLRLSLSDTKPESVHYAFIQEMLSQYAADEPGVKQSDKDHSIAVRDIFDNISALVERGLGEIIIYRHTPGTFLGGLAFKIKNDQDDMTLAILIVHQELRREGVARLLVQKVIEDARQGGTKRLYLLIHDDNQKMKALAIQSGAYRSGLFSGLRDNDRSRAHYYVIELRSVNLRQPHPDSQADLFSFGSIFGFLTVMAGMMKWDATQQALVMGPDHIHVRPSVFIASAAEKFKSEIRLRNLSLPNSRWVDAKNFKSVLSLTALVGHNIEIGAKGEDANEAVAAVAEAVSARYAFHHPETSISDGNAHLSVVAPAPFELLGLFAVGMMAVPEDSASRNAHDLSEFIASYSKPFAQLLAQSVFPTMTFPDGTVVYHIPAVIVRETLNLDAKKFHRDETVAVLMNPRDQTIDLIGTETLDGARDVAFRKSVQLIEQIRRTSRRPIHERLMQISATLMSSEFDRWIEVWPSLSLPVWRRVAGHIRLGYHLSADLASKVIPRLLKLDQRRRLIAGIFHLLHEALGLTVVVFSPVVWLGFVTITHWIGRHYILPGSVRSRKDFEKIVKAVEMEKENGRMATMVLGGEAAVAQSGVERMVNDYIRLAQWSFEKWGDSGLEIHVALKVSNLGVRFNSNDAGQMERVTDRLMSIALEMKKAGLYLEIDGETSDDLETVYNIVRKVKSHPDLKDWPGIGVAIQNYFVDTDDKVKNTVDGTKQIGNSFGLRLVKGAYYEFERQKNPLSVWSDKNGTDEAFRKSTRRIFSRTDVIYPMIASMNPREGVYASVVAMALMVPPHRWEHQTLKGMMEPLTDMFIKEGEQVRLYLLFGSVVSAMKYFARRRVEITGKEAASRRIYDKDVPAQDLAKISTATTETVSRFMLPFTTSSYFRMSHAHLGRGPISEIESENIKLFQGDLTVLAGGVLTGHGYPYGYFVEILNRPDNQKLLTLITSIARHHTIRFALGMKTLIRRDKDHRVIINAYLIDENLPPTLWLALLRSSAIRHEPHPLVGRRLGFTDQVFGFLGEIGRLIVAGKSERQEIVRYLTDRKGLVIDGEYLEEFMALIDDVHDILVKHNIDLTRGTRHVYMTYALELILPRIVGFLNPKAWSPQEIDITTLSKEFLDLLAVELKRLRRAEEYQRVVRTYHGQGDDDLPEIAVIGDVKGDPDAAMRLLDRAIDDRKVDKIVMTGDNPGQSRGRLIRLISDDLSSLKEANVITSREGRFEKDMEGLVLRIVSPRGNFIPGFYKIEDVFDEQTLILDRDVTEGSEALGGSGVIYRIHEPLQVYRYIREKGNTFQGRGIFLYGPDEVVFRLAMMQQPGIEKMWHDLYGGYWLIRERNKEIMQANAARGEQTPLLDLNNFRNDPVIQELNVWVRDRFYVYHIDEFGTVYVNGGFKGLDIETFDEWERLLRTETTLKQPVFEQTMDDPNSPVMGDVEGWMKLGRRGLKRVKVDGSGGYEVVTIMTGQPFFNFDNLILGADFDAPSEIGPAIALWFLGRRGKVVEHFEETQQDWQVTTYQSRDDYLRGVVQNHEKRVYLVAQDSAQRDQEVLSKLTVDDSQKTSRTLKSIRTLRQKANRGIVLNPGERKWLIRLAGNLLYGTPATSLYGDFTDKGALEIQRANGNIVYDRRTQRAYFLTGQNLIGRSYLTWLLLREKDDEGNPYWELLSHGATRLFAVGKTIFGGTEPLHAIPRKSRQLYYTDRNEKRVDTGIIPEQRIVEINAVILLTDQPLRERLLIKLWSKLVGRWKTKERRLWHQWRVRHIVELHQEQQRPLFDSLIQALHGAQIEKLNVGYTKTDRTKRLPRFARLIHQGLFDTEIDGMPWQAKVVWYRQLIKAYMGWEILYRLPGKRAADFATATSSYADEKADSQTPEDEEYVELPSVEDLVTFTNPIGPVEAAEGENEGWNFIVIAYVRNPNGIHARPTAAIVNTANKFEADVAIRNLGDTLWRTAKSRLSVMTLAAEYGQKVEIRAKGEDAYEAVRAVARIIADDRDLRAADKERKKRGKDRGNGGHETPSGLGAFVDLSGFAFLPFVFGICDLRLINRRLVDQDSNWQDYEEKEKQRKEREEKKAEEREKERKKREEEFDETLKEFVENLESVIEDEGNINRILDDLAKHDIRKYAIQKLSSLTDQGKLNRGEFISGLADELVAQKVFDASDRQALEDVLGSDKMKNTVNGLVGLAEESFIPVKPDAPPKVFVDAEYRAYS